jgi:phosphoribosyl 1,2-cyclic phosphate phosphodiesterase
MHNDLDYATLQAELPPHVAPAFDGMTVTYDAQP